MTTRFLVALGLALAAVSAAAPAQARGFGGGSQSGDSYLNDAQKNPRFIEPYAHNDPSRYRASHPQEGYYDRRAAQNYGGYGYGGRRYGY